MKERIGFVSNSSTASFIIYGTKINKAEKEQIFDDDQYEWKAPLAAVAKDEDLEIEEADTSDDSFIIGLQVARWSDDDFYDTQWEHSEVEESKLVAELKKLYPEKKFSYFGGTCAC